MTIRVKNVGSRELATVADKMYIVLHSYSILHITETGKWTKLHSMKSMCGFVAGILVDRPIHLEENVS